MTRAIRTVGVLVACSLVLAACSDDDDTTGANTAAEPTPTSAVAPVSSSTSSAVAPITSTTAAPLRSPYDVAMVPQTFTDTSRATPPSGDQPGTDERVLETLVFHPVGLDGAPYPLVVFSHGLGGTPEFSQPVIETWVAAGMVVAAPRFPLSRPDNPGGADAGDVQNQTGDVSFLIDRLVAESADPDSVFSGLVDPERVGAGGHSNGAITTIGVTLHTCCADERIDAAIAFAGTASPFADGDYDWDLAPPYVIVHGTEDQQVSYDNGVALFNDLDGPKGILTLDGGDHGSMFVPSAPGFDEVLDATTDFFRAYLGGDEAALARLAAPSAEGGYPSLRFVAEEGATDLIPTTTVAGIDRQVTVEPTSGLVDGQPVTVSWRGFTPGGSVNVVQCATADQGAGFCDLTTAQILVPDPTGAGTLQLEIVVGPVGAGTCGPGVTECVIAINDSGLTDPDATIYVPLDFGD